MLERRGFLKVPVDKRPDYFAVQGWTNCIRKMRYECDVVFLGNSLTASSDFQLYFPDKKIVEFGYSGNNMPRIIDRIDQVYAVNPSKVFIMAGTNDIVHMPLEIMCKNWISIIDSIHTNLPTAEIFVQSILPVNHEMRKDFPDSNIIKEANDSLKAIANTKNITYIELFDLFQKNGELPKELTVDGIHLTIKGYDLWAQSIRNYIE